MYIYAYVCIHLYTSIHILIIIYTNIQNTCMSQYTCIYLYVYIFISVSKFINTQIVPDAAHPSTSHPPHPEPKGVAPKSCILSANDADPHTLYTSPSLSCYSHPLPPTTCVAPPPFPPSLHQHQSSPPSATPGPEAQDVPPPTPVPHLLQVLSYYHPSSQRPSPLRPNRTPHPTAQHCFQHCDDHSCAHARMLAHEFCRPLAEQPAHAGAMCVTGPMCCWSTTAATPPHTGTDVSRF